MKKTVCICLASSLLFSGCMTAAQHQAALGTSEEEQLTVAAVQRDIRLGMSGAAVLAVLGSPNIVSTDSERHEVWVYDRVGTEYTYSEGSSSLVSLIAAAGSVAGGVLPKHEQRAGATRRSQKTLTIIIKFDEDKRVRDFSYHASRF